MKAEGHANVEHWNSDILVEPRFSAATVQILGSYCPDSRQLLYKALLYKAQKTQQLPRQPGNRGDLVNQSEVLFCHNQSCNKKHDAARHDYPAKKRA